MPSHLPFGPTRRGRLVGLAFAMAAGMATAAIACSSSSSGSGPSGGDAFCSAQSDYAKQCGKNDACTQALIQNCASFESNFSAVYTNAATDCVKPPYSCDGGTMAEQACIASHLASATPTAAQAKVKTDFCTQCPDGKSQLSPQSCTDFFSGSGASAGTLVLFGNDTIANQIDQQCTGASAMTDGGLFNDCMFAFLTCSATVFNSHVSNPSACDGGLTGMSLHLPLVPEN